jgi:hypothetical protein
VRQLSQGLSRRRPRRKYRGGQPVSVVATF